MTHTIAKKLTVAAIGSADFTRHLGAGLHQAIPHLPIVSASLTEAWSAILAHRPNCVVLDIGLRHSEKHHLALRDFLARVRERFSNEIYVIVAMTAPERFAFAGDLLFSEEQESSPSGLVDSFVVTPPGGFPTAHALLEQSVNALSMAASELERRSMGKAPLPSLNASGWVQSLADPGSRELWMKWLPRYATYTNDNPIIIGATGTGKTNLAYALHLLSGRRGEFISITPRDFSSSELVQAELFGAVAGAYTGAVDKWGLVKSAQGGTLFIDELQSIDKELQGKLITFIENKFYRRVGSSERVEADVRFVFASNRSLSDMMESDVLRHDFAYRLERVQLELLPLCDRKLDIAAAMGYALAKIHRQRPHSRSIFGFSSSAYRLVFSQRWPGNLRQLENAIARMCELTDINGGNIIDEHEVVEVLKNRLSSTPTSRTEVYADAALRVAEHVFSSPPETFQQSVEMFVEHVQRSALAATGGDPHLAGQLIGEDPELLTHRDHATKVNHIVRLIT